MKQIKFFALALVACFFGTGSVAAQELSLVTGNPDAEQSVGESSQAPVEIEKDYGDWKLTAKSMEDGGWEPTVYSIGLGTDWALWDEEGCHSLDIYRRGGMKGLLAEEYLKRGSQVPADSFQEALRSRSRILRDEVIQLRCAPDETLAPPMFLASGVHGFTLSNGFSTARIPNRVAIANKMDGYRSEVRELSLKRIDLAPVDVGAMADTAAAIGPMMVNAYDADLPRPAPERDSAYKANRAPNRVGSYITHKWKYNSSTKRWDNNSNGARFHRIETADIYIDGSDLDTGSSCNDKSRHYVRDLGGGENTDHCGHVLANRLSGNGQLRAGDNDMTHVNFFAQNGSINSGSFRVYEGKIYDATFFPNSCCGCSMGLDWSFNFHQTAVRPNWIDYQATVVGTGASPCGLRFKSIMGTNFTFKIQGFNNPR